jgi:hypothetical protein
VQEGENESEEEQTAAANPRGIEVQRRGVTHSQGFDTNYSHCQQQSTTRVAGDAAATMTFWHGLAVEALAAIMADDR